MRLITTLLFTLLILQSCTHAILAPEGMKTQIVDTISLTDLLAYDKIDSFISMQMSSEENCRNDLRNQAGRAGIEFIKITSTAPVHCNVFEDLSSSKVEKKCFTMNADGYRKKEIGMVPTK